MVMNSTSTEAVSIQAVLAMLSVGASAANASVGATSSSKTTPSLQDLQIVIIITPVVGLLFIERRPGLAGTAAHDLFQAVNEDFSVADFSGPRGLGNGFTVCPRCGPAASYKTRAVPEMSCRRARLSGVWIGRFLRRERD